MQAMLQQIQQPAFLVSDGVISAVNEPAQQRFAVIGTDISQLLVTGKEEYAQFQSGSLYLTICVNGTKYTCTVTQMQEYQLFTLEEDTAGAELQVLSLAAQQLSMPVSDMMLLLDQLSEISSASKAQITQKLYVLKRIIGNMADTAQLANAQPKYSLCDISAVFAEILEKSQTLLAESGIDLTYELPDSGIYTTANTALLNRAIYNLLSNAAKFSTQNSIQATLRQNGKMVYFTVTSKGSSQYAAKNQLFHRYTRQPGLEERKYGLGLGMTLIHSAATTHGGTVLMQHGENDEIRFTLTMRIQKNTETAVRSPILVPDLYGGHDQGLIELSDVLPYQLYNKEIF